MLLDDVIQDSISQEAIKQATFYSKNWEETLTGKMMLTNLGIIKKIVDTIQGIDVDKLPEGSGGSSKML